MFLFVRDLLGDAPAFVAGVAYAYLPYQLSDAYVRGNFPEFLAISVLPLALWAFRRLFDLRSPSNLGIASAQSFDSASLRSGLRLAMAMLIAALAFAAIILLHHLTAMLFAALLLAYILFLFAMQRDGRGLLACAGAVLLALALSAFYWLPSIAELNLVYVGPASVARFLVNRLVSLADFFAPSLAYDYLPQSEALKHSAGFPQTLLALAAGIVSVVVLLRATFAKQSPTRDLIAASQPFGSAESTRSNGEGLRSGPLLAMTSVFFFLVVAASIAMTLSLSAPVWYAIPVLRFLQFPWRFQILAGVGIAFLLGVWSKWLADAVSRFNASTAVCTLACLVLVALGIANLPVRAFPLTDADVNLLRSGDSDYVVAQMGWGWTREFVPATVSEFDAIYTPFVKTSPVPPNPPRTLPAITVEEDGGLARTFQVAAQEPFELSLHTFFFPGWQAYIDGVPARTYPRGGLGLATVTVPAGAHAVAFRFEDTPLRAAATAVSLVAFGAVGVGLFIARRRAAIVLIVVFVVIAVMLVWHTRDVRAQPPSEASVDLERRVLLIGYSAERENDALLVTLHWLALQEFGEDYTSFVHLVNARGDSVAQSEGTPDQGLTPTTRWIPGEIIADRRVVPLREVTPGEYRIVAGMYLPTAGGFTNLGSPIDLGRVGVSR